MEIGVLFDEHDELAWRLDEALTAEGFACALNAPYSGKPPERLIYSAQRHGHTYSIGLIRATGTKGLDHAQKRRLRTHLGRVLFGRFRREDVRGRWDDDIFVVGFDGSSARAVVEVVRRLQDELEAQRLQRPEELSFLHAAIGLSSYPLDGDTTRSLILAAHERLKTAVERGEDALVWR